MADITGFTVTSTDFDTGGGMTISGTYTGGGNSDDSTNGSNTPTNNEDIFIQVQLDGRQFGSIWGNPSFGFGSQSWQKTFSLTLDAADLALFKGGTALRDNGNAVFRFYDKETSNDGDNELASAVNVSPTTDGDGNAQTYTKVVATPTLSAFNISSGSSDLNNSSNGVTLVASYATTGTSDSTDDLIASDYQLFYKFGTNGTYQSIPATLTFVNGTLTAVITQANANLLQGHNNVIFQLKQVHHASGSTDVTITETDSTQFNITCFYPGTMIATPEGEKSVETLTMGDMVLRADGSVSAVRWMGRSTISTLFADKTKALPIRIRKDALAENVPSRDLLVSPDHAIFVDGILAQAGALINGTSIVRETDVPTMFAYHHVELADHALIMAEKHCNRELHRQCRPHELRQLGRA